MPAAFPQVQFNKIYGGSGDDYALSIAAAAAGGGFAVAGSTWSNDGDVSGNHGNSSTIDGWIIKLDTGGNIRWKKTIGGSRNDITFNIQSTPDGGYIIAGNTTSNDGDVSGNHGDADGWIIKLDSSGAIGWQKTFGGSGSELFYCILPGSDGSYTVAGSTSSNDGDVSGLHGGADAWVVKLDRNGNKIWQRTLGGSEFEQFLSITAGKGGGYVAAGSTRSDNGDVTGLKGQGRSDMWVVRLDEAGNTTWQKTLGGTDDENANAVVAAADGGFIIAGDTYSHDGDVVGNNESQDGWVVKLDAAGNKVWQRTLFKSYVNSFEALIKNGEDFVAAGQSYSKTRGSVNNRDVWVATIKNQ